MAHPISSPIPAAATANTDDAAIWQNLKEAIATSSGFQQWKQEQSAEQTTNVDSLVRRYLRETLETLAY